MAARRTAVREQRTASAPWSVAATPPALMCGCRLVGCCLYALLAALGAVLRNFRTIEAQFRFMIMRPNRQHVLWRSYMHGRRHLRVDYQVSRLRRRIFTPGAVPASVPSSSRNIRNPCPSIVGSDNQAPGLESCQEWAHQQRDMMLRQFPYDPRLFAVFREIVSSVLHVGFLHVGKPSAGKTLWQRRRRHPGP